MDTRKVCIVMVGFPGSGKSFTRQLIQNTWGDDSLEVVSSDDKVEQYARQEGKTYSDVFRVAIEPSQALARLDRESALKLGKSLLLDQTHLTEKSRFRALSGLPKDYVKIALVVQVGEQTRQERLLQRPGKVIPLSVDRTMREIYRAPGLDEGFDAIVSPDVALKMLQPWFRDNALPHAAYEKAVECV